jgi:Glycosyl hydrolase family 9/Cellulase N-terminal ig-like domain
MNIRSRFPVFLVYLLLNQIVAAQEIKTLVNHLGYETDAPKRAVILGHAGDDVNTFKIIDARNGKEILSGKTAKVGPVDKWKDWIFWTADFSAVNTEGSYFIECATGKGAVRSLPFHVERNLLEKYTLPDVISWFKGQRSSGLLDKADHNLKFDGSTNTADVHGGWFDATGDYGKHLSHLSFSTYFNPQQIPLSDWSLFKSYEELQRRGDPNFRQYKRRLLDEAMFGADYLVRVKSPNGSFYRSISAPGPEKAAEDRRIAREGSGFAIKTNKNATYMGETHTAGERAEYEVAYRSGGGAAIAALAIASTYPVSGEFSNAQYLKAAEDAFAFLETNNQSYLNGGKENIVDDYCALLAATELFKATKNDHYKLAADRRAGNLLSRLITSGGHTNYWRADDGDRPFFHAADAGLPVLSLLEYCKIADAPARKRVLETVRKSLEFELQTTSEVANPFGYARQLVQSTNGFRRTAFFFPHDTETAPWWQGENARLSSLATAARMAVKYFKDDPTFCHQLQEYAWDQLNWILGENPYDCCMLQGTGRNNPFYMFFDAYEYHNAPGGIVNGITSGYKDPHDIDFDLQYSETGKDEDWRWGEQWLPHAAWYLLAVSIKN